MHSRSMKNGRWPWASPSSPLKHWEPRRQRRPAHPRPWPGPVARTQARGSCSPTSARPTSGWDSCRRPPGAQRRDPDRTSHRCGHLDRAVALAEHAAAGSATDGFRVVAAHALTTLLDAYLTAGNLDKGAGPRPPRPAPPSPHRPPGTALLLGHAFHATDDTTAAARSWREAAGLFRALGAPKPGTPRRNCNCSTAIATGNSKSHEANLGDCGSYGGPVVSDFSLFGRRSDGVCRSPVVGFVTDRRTSWEAMWDRR